MTFVSFTCDGTCSMTLEGNPDWLSLVPSDNSSFPIPKNWKVIDGALFCQKCAKEREVVQGRVDAAVKRCRCNKCECGERR
jgi:hypothetical protein